MYSLYIMIFTLRCSNVCSYVSYDVAQCFFRCSQKRSVYSLLVNKISSKMKERIDDRQSKSKLKHPECIQTSKINEDTKDPLLKTPQLNSSTGKPIQVLSEKIFKRKTSMKQSTESVILPNWIHSSIRKHQYHVTDLPATVSTDSVVRNFRRKFQHSRFSSSGLKCLNNASDFVINKYVLHKEYPSVQQILGNISSSSPTVLFFSIFIGILIPEYIYPLHIFTMPSTGGMYPIMKDMIRDTYVNHVCITHTIPSPCTKCSEGMNTLVKEFYPQPSFDPLEEHPTQKLKNITLTIGTLILLVILMNKTGNSELVVSPM